MSRDLVKFIARMRPTPPPAAGTGGTAEAGTAPGGTVVAGYQSCLHMGTVVPAALRTARAPASTRAWELVAHRRKRVERMPAERDTSHPRGLLHHQQLR